MKTKLFLIICTVLVSSLSLQAQELTVKSITVACNDLSASQYERKDLAGQACGLVKVQLAAEGALFEGNVFGKVEYKTSEYWVYMTQGSYMLRIKHPKFVPLDVNLHDYGIPGVESKTTYTLTLLMENKNQNLFFQKEQKSLPPVIQNLINNMVHVEGGTFIMGTIPGQDRVVNYLERPSHQVTLSSFSIGKYEVTQEEWEAVMGANSSNNKGAKLPVECVSWDGCQIFIRNLNNMTGRQFHLPTEAEWEFAARGGNDSKGYKYSGSDNLDNVAWYKGHCGRTTHEVGLKSPNELGIYDMNGNVSEWCQDWLGRYSSSSQTNPVELTEDNYRIIRGGDWKSDVEKCRVSARSIYYPTKNLKSVGFRLAL